MQKETHVALVEHIVYHFLIELCAQGTRREALRFATGKDGAAVRHGKRIYLAPDGTDFVGLTTIETLAFVENATAHSVAQHVVVVASSQCMLLF